MELTDEQRQILSARLTELTNARDRLITQANLELARIEARRDELQQLLAPDTE